MRAGAFALMVAMAAAWEPATAQIADRVGQDRRREGGVVATPTPADRGRASGAVVTAPDWRGRRDGDCRLDVRGGRDRTHVWYDSDGRSDCDDRWGGDVRYGQDRRPIGVPVRSALLREHSALNAQLEREHERWHRSHGWYPRNRGWEKSHAALHRRLEREHDRWHQRNRVPLILPGDRYRYDDVPGRGRGYVVIR